MKIGLCTIAFRDSQLDTVLDLAARNGFDGVEIWGKPEHTPEIYDSSHNQRVAEAARNRGLAISQFGSYANPTSDRFEEEMAETLRIARDLGTDKIRVWAGDTGSAEADSQHWETAISGFRIFSDRASDAGFTLVLEMHSNRLTDTAEGCLRLLGQVDRSNLRLNFQPMSDHNNSRVMEEVGKVALYVTTVHAQNIVQVGETRRGLISEGVVDYPGVIEALRKAGFDGYVEVEFVREDDPEEALKADAKFLRSLVNK